MSVFPAYDAQVARATAVEPAAATATDDKVFARVAPSIDAPTASLCEAHAQTTDLGVEKATERTNKNGRQSSLRG